MHFLRSSTNRCPFQLSMEIEGNLCFRSISFESFNEQKIVGIFFTNLLKTVLLSDKPASIMVFLKFRLTVCINEVGEFIAGPAPVEISNRRVMIKLPKGFLGKVQPPNPSCHVVAAQVPMSRPNFGNALLAAVNIDKQFSPVQLYFQSLHQCLSISSRYNRFCIPNKICRLNK